MLTEIKVPSLGESVITATVSRWIKKAGDTVDRDEPIVELETDKVTVEVNAPESGRISSISAEEGSEVEVGSVLGALEVTGETSASRPAANPQAGVNPPPPPSGPVARNGTTASLPAARKMMDEREIAPEDIGTGSGKGGRITKGDVIAFLDRKPEAGEPTKLKTPRVDEVREERVRMTRLRRTIAERLKEAQNTAAMLTTFNEVDLSAVMALRAQYKDVFERKHGGIRLGLMSFFIKACVVGLQEFPAVNAEIDGNDIVYKHFVNMGIAVSGPNGLVVPVIRDADQLGFPALEAAITDFGKRAYEGTIRLDELSGGTFSITNGGIFGSLMSTPILNPPQSGILGMHKIQERPIAIDGKLEIRSMMYLALSYDHRIVDGREAVSFLVRVKENIEDPQRLLLDI